MPLLALKMSQSGYNSPNLVTVVIYYFGGYELDIAVRMSY